ncbi:MAG: HYR domain-containing protein, partial [Saprospiraceae bacterium]
MTAQDCTLSASFAEVNDISCNGAMNGSILLEAEVAQSGTFFSRYITYQWNTGDFTKGITELAPGAYQVTVTEFALTPPTIILVPPFFVDPPDILVCTKELEIVLTQPFELEFELFSTFDVTCNGGSDGKLYMSTSGGTPPYSYNWYGNPAYQPTDGAEDAIDVPAGLYNVRVTDANGCTVVLTDLEVTEPTPVTVSIGNVTNADCAGNETGEATANGAGGTGAITYLWSNGSTDATAEDLHAGGYVVTATDANGCTAVASTFISDPNGLIFDIINVSDVSCNGESDGTVSLGIIGGTSPYTLIGYTGANTVLLGQPIPFATIVTDLSAGSHTFLAADANGCIVVAHTTVDEPTELISDVITSTDVLCNGDANGTATVHATGGTTPYTYAWTSGATTATATGLAAGPYTVTVTDANGCETIENVTVTEPAVLATTTPQLDDVSCNGGNDGKIYFQVTGGTAPYSYNWTGFPNAGGFQIPDDVQDQDAVPAGTYNVVITDSNGCTTEISNIEITEPTPVTVSIGNVIDADCAGNETGEATATGAGGTGTITYAWSDGQTGATAEDLHAGGYSVTATDANGCTAQASTSIADPNGLIVLATAITDISCNGGSDGSIRLEGIGGTSPYTITRTGSGGVFNNVNIPFAGLNGNLSIHVVNSLEAGHYAFRVTDMNGCNAFTSITLDEPTQLISDIITSTDVSCNGGADGTATVYATGGTTPYTYAWNDPAAQTTATATGLAAGAYMVVVTDANGCQTAQTITIFEPAELILSLDFINDVSCNGGSDGDIYINIDGGTAPYNYYWAGSTAADNTQDAVDVPAGTYTLLVIDANGCTFTLPNLVVGEPTPVTVYIDDVINADCAGGETGSATAYGAGGTGTITYAWSNGQTDAENWGIHAGGYSVTATDANGCTAQASTSISDPNGLSMEVIESSQPWCNGDANGSVTLGILNTGNLGGTSPYRLTSVYYNGHETSGLNIPFSGNTLYIDDLGAGQYSFVVKDDNNCEVAQDFTMDEPTLLIADVITKTDVSCNGDADGTATVYATGGTTPYTYEWSDGQTTVTATGLAAGTYTVTVTDDNDCTAEISIIIEEPATLSASVSSTSDVTCNAGSDGSIQISVNGGTAPYSYDWTGNVPADDVQDALNIPAGTYGVLITDANGCTTEITNVVITEPTPVTVSIGNVVNADCAGNETGSATATGMGGTGAISYAWSNGQTGANATGLHAGGYSVTATDANGCEAQASIFISDPTGMSMEVLLSNDPSCNGGSDGSVTLGILQTQNLGGTPPYTLTRILKDLVATNVNVPFTGQTLLIENLSAGQYSFIVSDNNGCEVVEEQTIGEPTLLIAETIHTTDALCNGSLDGTATVNATGGTTPYTYAWSSGAISATATGLAAGNYTVTVTDANGCEATSTATIGEPTPIIAFVASTTNVSCNGESDGSIELTVIGGTPPYSYAWTGNIPADDVQDALNIPAGTYGVVITDSNGCTTEITNINISEPSPLTVTIGDVMNADCAGNETGSAVATASGGTGSIYNYAWSNGQNGTNQATATGLHAGGYSVTVTDENGCTAQASTFISDPNGLEMTVFNLTDVSCNGGADGTASVVINGGTPPYTFNAPLVATGPNNATASGLAAGSYVFTAIDANGCPVSVSAQIDEPTLLIAEIIATSDALCNGSADGTATVNATGGTTGYTYAWSDGQTTAIATGLTAGTYGVTVTDANNCTAETTATVGEPDLLTIAVGATFDVSCNGGFDGSIYINNPIGGTGPFNYEWTSTTGFIFDQATDNAQDQVNNLPAGSYNVTVTDDNGCTFAINDIVINEPTLLTVSIADVMNANCIGNEDGSATATAAGGTAPYTYAWSNGDATATATALHAGGYTVIATDANGCTAMASVSITDPNGLLFGITESTDVSCNGGSDGTATFGIIGGTAPYALIGYIGPNGQQVDLSGSPLPVEVGTIFPNMSAGLYAFFVQDANGCLTANNVIIHEPTELFAEIIHQEDVTCPGGSDGEATVNATGGTTPYTYEWSASAGSQTTNIATGLVEGLHSVTVTDANGCTDVINVVILQNDDVAPEFVTTIPGDVTVECDAIPTPFVVIPAWHTTDNCTDAANILVDYTETIIDIVCPNTYTIKRKWTITDEAGNTAFHIQKVYVQDTTAPTFTVPADVTIECDESTLPANTGDVTDQMDNCSAPADIVVAYTDVEDYSGCGGYTGTITRTWTATDECGNVTTKVQVITIEDTTAPTALCNSFTIELDENGEASITIAQVDAGSTDNCASLMQLTYALDKLDFTCADLGANIVTLSVTDPCGNTGTCEATITVEDNIDPIITCPGDMVIHLDPGACDQVISYDVLATDNCDVTVAQIGGLYSSGDAFPIGGPYVLTYEATDEAGNTAQCSFSVTVIEYVPTSNDLTCNSLVHVTLDENCEALVTADMVLEGNNYGCYDDYVITVTDANGIIVPGNLLTLANVGTVVEVSILDPDTGITCWGEILVEDKLIPTFDCPADIDVTCNGATDPAITGEPTLTSCEASVTIEFEDDYTDFGCAGDPSDSSVRARIIRTWTVTDESGNSDQCVQNINILKPALADVVFPNDLDEINGDALDCAAVAANPALTGPNFTGYPQYVNQDVTPGGLCAFSIGYVDSELEICAGGSSYEIIRTWTVRNMCEPLVPGVNPLVQIQSIKVLDTTAPALACPAPTTLSTTGNSCDVAVTLPAANVSDDCSGYEVYVETANGTLNSNGGFIGTFGIGEHTVTYYATDACGNISSCDYTFEVADQISPISICDEHTTVAIGSDGTASIDAISFDDGSFDACSDVTFDVRRMDNPACPGSDFTSYGPSVPFFCCDVNTIVMVELRVTDASGNTNSCMVEVEVEDKIDPTVICPSDKDVECSETYLDYIVQGQPLPQEAIDANGAALASDNCPGVTLTNTVISNGVDCGNGIITIVWTATDGGGRTSSCIQRYFVANNDPFFIVDTEHRLTPINHFLPAVGPHSSQDDVEWPADIELTTCGLGLEPADLEANYPLDAYPQIFEGACDNIAVGHHDQVLDFGVDDACLKVLRKWYVIDW